MELLGEFAVSVPTLASPPAAAVMVQFAGGEVPGLSASKLSWKSRSADNVGSVKSKINNSTLMNADNRNIMYQLSLI